jgi:hypothetical protein
MALSLYQAAVAVELGLGLVSLAASGGEAFLGAGYGKRGVVHGLGVVPQGTGKMVLVHRGQKFLGVAGGSIRAAVVS